MIGNENIMLHVNRTDGWLNKRAIEPPPPSKDKGIFPLRQRGFLGNSCYQTDFSPDRTKRGYPLPTLICPRVLLFLLFLFALSLCKTSSGFFIHFNSKLSLMICPLILCISVHLESNTVQLQAYNLPFTFGRDAYGGVRFIYIITTQSFMVSINMMMVLSNKLIRDRQIFPTDF